MHQIGASTLLLVIPANAGFSTDACRVMTNQRFFAFFTKQNSGGFSKQNRIMSDRSSILAPLLHDCDAGPGLLAQVEADDLDAALDAGLMEFIPCPSCDAEAATKLLEAQRKLTRALAARERYRTRGARLARIAAEREARRAPVIVQKKPALPPAAAAILARAKAKAAERHNP